MSIDNGNTGCGFERNFRSDQYRGGVVNQTTNRPIPPIAEPSLADTLGFVVTVFRSPDGRPRVDKHGLPMWQHSFDVMMALPFGSNLHLRQVALLHDVLEDTSVTVGDLEEMRFDFRVISTVIELTRRPEQTYRQYIDSISTLDALRVKLADNFINTNRAPLPGNTEPMSRYAKVRPVLMAKLQALGYSE